MWFDQTLSSKEAIENAQMYQLGMKLARLSKEGKEDFHSKAKTVWNFLTKATGILDPKTFQVILHKTAKNSLFFVLTKPHLHLQFSIHLIFLGLEDFRLNTQEKIPFFTKTCFFRCTTAFLWTLAK